MNYVWTITITPPQDWPSHVYTVVARTASEAIATLCKAARDSKLLAAACYPEWVSGVLRGPAITE